MSTSFTLPSGSTYDPQEISDFLAQLGCPRPIFEHEFFEGRKWRFDLAWPEHRVALEVHGGLFSGGRHNTAAGFLRDMEKENAAACCGWRILKTTPQALKSFGTAALIKKAISFSP